MTTLHLVFNSIYLTLQQRGLCTQKHQFEREWLGRCRGYMSVVRRQASDVLATATRLHFRLAEMHQPDLAADIYAAMRQEARRRRRHPQTSALNRQHDEHRWRDDGDLVQKGGA